MDAEDIIETIERILLEPETTTKHIRIDTLGCGEITCPVDHITLHTVGGTYRLLIRDDIEWREISGATYNYIKEVLDHA